MPGLTPRQQVLTRCVAEATRQILAGEEGERRWDRLARDLQAAADHRVSLAAYRSFRDNEYVWTDPNAHLADRPAKAKHRQQRPTRPGSLVASIKIEGV